MTASEWDTDDALESVLAEWFPHGLPAAETGNPETTEDLLDAALAALLEVER